ncbi:MAG: RNA-binding S4 domain-containing protein, partial [Clostridiales bacterium]|nr:RNA-binding S4 domain-containing protein [Clostridiales bacterium]
RLAYELTKTVHGAEEADKAAAQAKAAFGGEGEMPEKQIPASVNNLVGALVATGLCKSNGEARRLVEQGGVSVNGEKATDANAALPEGDFTLFKGKKVRLKVVRV